MPVGECVCFLTGFFDFLGIGGSLSPSGDGLLADLFLGRPRSRRYPKFNIRRDIPRTDREALKVGARGAATESFETHRLVLGHVYDRLVHGADFLVDEKLLQQAALTELSFGAREANATPMRLELNATPACPAR